MASAEGSGEAGVQLTEGDKRELRDAVVYNPNVEKAQSILEKYPSMDINTCVLGVCAWLCVFGEEK